MPNMTRSFGKIPDCYLFARRRSDPRLSFDVFDEFTQRGDAVRLPDDMRMQTDIHDAPGSGAFGN